MKTYYFFILMILGVAQLFPAQRKESCRALAAEAKAAGILMLSDGPILYPNLLRLVKAERSAARQLGISFDNEDVQSVLTVLTAGHDIPHQPNGSVFTQVWACMRFVNILFCSDCFMRPSSQEIATFRAMLSPHELPRIAEVDTANNRRYRSQLNNIRLRFPNAFPRNN